jgi:hypothetical protein
MRAFIVLSFLIFSTSSLHANIKNLYIILEPNALKSQKNSDKRMIVPMFEKLLMIGKWVSPKDNTPKFKKVFIRIAGGNSYIFSKKKIHKLSRKSTFIEMYQEVKAIKSYSFPKTLAYFPQDLELNGWRGEETLLLIMGDINFVQNGITSHGKYLNSAWLESKKSPFVKYLLLKDNTPAKDASVMVLTRTQLNLKDEKMRKDFIVNLFAHTQMGMQPYFIGEDYNIFNAPDRLKPKDNYILKILKDIKDGRRDGLKVNQLPKTTICQIVGAKESITIRNCGGIQ